jgi:hypothetical protein
MSALDSVANDLTLFAELEKDHPRGMSFAHTNGTVIRTIVSILNERLSALAAPVRLRIEPPLEAPGHHRTQPPKLPKRLIVKTPHGSHRVELVVGEQYVLPGEEKLICTARDGAVSRVAASIIAAIKKVLGKLE